jgi:hypothetical protein
MKIEEVKTEIDCENYWRYNLLMHCEHLHQELRKAQPILSTNPRLVFHCIFSSFSATLVTMLLSNASQKLDRNTRKRIVKETVDNFEKMFNHELTNMCHKLETLEDMPKENMQDATSH